MYSVFILNPARLLDPHAWSMHQMQICWCMAERQQDAQHHVLRGCGGFQTDQVNLGQKKKQNRETLEETQTQ